VQQDEGVTGSMAFVIKFQPVDFGKSAGGCCRCGRALLGQRQNAPTDRRTG
jgi:hypothetical protein